MSIWREEIFAREGARPCRNIPGGGAFFRRIQEEVRHDDAIASCATSTSLRLYDSCVSCRHDYDVVRVSARSALATMTLSRGARRSVARFGLIDGANGRNPHLLDNT
jgi:hypothetical protein